MSHLVVRPSYRAFLNRRLIAAQGLIFGRPARQPGVFFKYPPFQSPAEERVNGLTHGVAALVSLAGGVWLIAAAMRQADSLMVAGCAAYCATLTAVLTMSTLSHVVGPPRLRQVFRVLDQAAIYLLTAGSFTPYFIRFLLPHGWGWLLVALWGIALVGALDKLRGNRVNSVSIVWYLLLGWSPVLAAKPLLSGMPPGCLALVISAGTCYMLGVAFLVWDERCRFLHAVWHLLVVAASACTYAGIALYVV